MRLIIQTPVQGDYREVLARFDQALFEQLTPPGAKVELLRFDGSETGDLVHIRLFLPLMKPQDWVSEIVDHGTNEQQAWFVDEGRTLPWFLSQWQHRHVVRQADGHCVIVDDITFRGPVWLPDAALYPVLWLQFAARRPVYRRVFGEVGK